jgi:hypothetical protein
MADSSFDKVAKTVAFDETVAATYIVHATDAGRKFAVTRWYLQSYGASTMKFMSGTTDISGVFTLGVSFYSDGGGTNPVLFGVDLGDDFKVVLTGAVRVAGYFVLAQI